jgi:hypothetical protein
MAMGETSHNSTSYKTGIKYKWLLGDLLAVINVIRSTKKISFIKHLFDKVDGYDDYYKDDILPFFASIILYIKRFIWRAIG